MSTRTALTVVGAVVGAYFGYPQLGFVIGSMAGAAVDPQQIQGPRIGEVNAQTSIEGAPRTIIFGVYPVFGNIIQTGQVVKVETSESQGKGGPEVSSERAYRTFAIRICEGPIAGVLRIWEDNKLIYDVRDGSAMLAESEKWAANKVLYLGGEDQLPDPTLVATVDADTPAYRGSAYMVFVSEDVTDRQGSIKQYRFEAAKDVAAPSAGTTIDDSDSITPTAPAPGIFRAQTGALGVCYRVAGGSVAVNGGFWNVREYTASDMSAYTTEQVNTSPSAGSSIYWNGDGINVSGFRLQGGNENYAICMNDSTFGGCYLVVNGNQVAALKPNASFADDWWSNTGGSAPEFDGRRIWFSNTHVYVGTTVRNGVNVNGLGRWRLIGGFPLYAESFISNICATPGQEFYTHFGNDSKMRIVADGELRTYSEDLSVQESVVTLPFTTSNLHGFGLDGDVAVFVYSSPVRADIRKVSDWSLTTSISDGVFLHARDTRIIFTDDSLFIQTQTNIGTVPSVTYISRIPYVPGSGTGLPAVLGDIVSEIHDRCGSESSTYDVSDLPDEVAGFGLAGDYTGASAIDALRPVYNFDKSLHDGKFWYPKRGAAVIETLTVDDLTEIPDTTKREQALDVPRKFHLRYQHAASGYAPVKASVPRTPSPDFLTTGEASMEIPVVLNEDQAMQCADKMYKVMRAEQAGTTEITVPMYVGAKYAEGGCIGLSLRGRVGRYRIEQADFADWKIKLTLKPDRQSAYTSVLTGVPIVEPTLPPSTIVGATELAVMDIACRVDSEDELGLVIAVDGALPPWYGARYQRSLDGGASYTTVEDMTTASVMGVLLDDVTAASEHYTDTTNVVRVQLYRATHSLESITETEFLSEGGAFALENADGSWEICQGRDWVDEGSQVFAGTILHRGRLNSGATAHLTGRRFVKLDRPTHFPAQASWIGQSVTHRAISLGETADDTTNDVSLTFVGRSQLEWPVASFVLSRSGNNVTASWAPRHRFGSEDAPVASANFQGYRVTIVGTSTVTFDQTATTFTYDVTAIGGGVTVNVSAINRITGAGPATSGSI